MLFLPESLTTLSVNFLFNIYTRRMVRKYYQSNLTLRYELFVSMFKYSKCLFCFNPILLGGGDNFVLHSKFFPIISIWAKLHENVIRYVLKIYFSIFSSTKPKFSTSHVISLWPHYGICHQSHGQTSQKQKCCNFNWYIRTKFHREVYINDCKWPKLNF